MGHTQDQLHREPFCWQIYIFINFLLAPIQILTKWSQLIFAHDMTPQLSYHEMKYVAIRWIGMELKKEFNIKWKENCKYNGCQDSVP